MLAQQDLNAKLAQFPPEIRDKVQTALTDASVAFKIRVGNMLADKEELEEHAVTTAGRVGAKSGEVSELTTILPLKPGGADRLHKFLQLIDGTWWAPGRPARCTTRGSCSWTTTPSCCSPPPSTASGPPTATTPPPRSPT
ncbi:hypothetical protein [Streptomyces sp. NPDC001205]